MRKCKICGETKNTEDFYSCNKVSCKECHKKRTVLWQKNNPQKFKECVTKQIAKRRVSPTYRKKQAEYYRKWYKIKGRKRTKRDRELINLWRKLNPEKCRARSLVYVALKSGKLKKPKHCSNCGLERKLLAHHDDYEFPLKIRWLCYSCHQKLHNGIDFA